MFSNILKIMIAPNELIEGVYKKLEMSHYRKSINTPVTFNCKAHAFYYINIIIDKEPAQIIQSY